MSGDDPLNIQEALDGIVTALADLTDAFECVGAMLLTFAADRAGGSRALAQELERQAEACGRHRAAITGDPSPNRHIIVLATALRNLADGKTHTFGVIDGGKQDDGPAEF